MTTLNEDLESFIDEWYWDEKFHQYAQELGQFILGFLHHLTEQNLSKKTIKKHTDNCWLIGAFECGYGFREQFSPEEVFFSSEANYETEFTRKVSDSSYAIASYRSTWRKIYKYTQEVYPSIAET
ncbi:MAG: hypothetical protein AB4058_19705 [Microcystaceae cyanobacterium]